jgi:hypothetical protein
MALLIFTETRINAQKTKDPFFTAERADKQKE